MSDLSQMVGAVHRKKTRKSEWGQISTFDIRALVCLPHSFPRAARLGKVTIIHDDRELMRLASSRSVRLVLTLERTEQMPKYLIQGSYSQQGLKGMLKEGGSKRREAAEQIIKGTGGRLESYYYAFGSDDFVIIADLPSNVDAAALSFAVNASGAVQSRMTVLITPEEADEATKKMKTVKYRAPGE
jgi:uncharacterized protein with GYD domain